VTSVTTLRGLLLAALLLESLPARADVFSPGPLSRAHQALEGLQNCTKCHVAGEQLAPETCLACHGEVKARLEQGKGFHGRIAAAERACERCHAEHQGRDFALVNWGPATPTVKGGKSAFDHGRAGFALKGKHVKVDCARCHDPRLVADAGVKELLRKQPGRATFLGAPTACASCHFDEHRGQVGSDCARCHGEDGWKPARGFDHAKAAYKLDGKHLKVECARCHKPEDEPARAAPPGFTAPVRPAAFVRYKPLKFQGCLDCHKDPHQSRFGDACARCHTTDDWKRVTGDGAQKAFHEKTRYPLRGAHAAVACEACHGPWPGQKARYKDMAFGQCTDCHLDAHVGQLQAAAPAIAPGTPAPRLAAAAPQACDACHTVNGWTPVKFDVPEHDRLPYRLEGAHRAVACALCHPKDERLLARVPAAAKEELARKKRPLKVSLALLDVPKATDCRTCHRDPHAGQLDARQKEQGCAACHGLASFKKVRFDHQKDSNYPLTGKHLTAACASCHRQDAAGVVRYRPLASTCATCHADVHAAQFAVKGQGTDCARCHETAGWKAPLRFRHEKPFTSFTLDGKHRKLECAKCHPAVQAAGAEVRRYRPLPTECQGCHADFHKGAFRGYVP
jgi:hypothetical protein